MHQLRRQAWAWANFMCGCALVLAVGCGVQEPHAVTSNGTTGSGGSAPSSASYGVQLAWDAPSAGTDPIAGYDVYRAVSGSGNFALLNGPVVSTTSYSDMNVPSGNWDYEVRSVDASGVSSAPSNVFTIAVP